MFLQQVWGREENSETDRDSDSAPHALSGAGGSGSVVLELHQARPEMGMYRDGATLYT